MNAVSGVLPKKKSLEITPVKKKRVFFSEVFRHNAGEFANSPAELGGMVEKLENAEIRKRAAARFEILKKEFEEKSNDYQKRFFEKIPKRYQRGWLSSFLGKASARAMIAAKCFDCVGWEDVQNSVGKCSSRTCPTWHARPHQSGD